MGGNGGHRLCYLAATKTKHDTRLPQTLLVNSKLTHLLQKDGDFVLLCGGLLGSHYICLLLIDELTGSIVVIVIAVEKMRLFLLL